MKTLFRNLFLAVISCFCIVSLVSCSGGIKGDEAKSFINDFFAVIVAEDYDKAEAFLHPDRPGDLESFLLNVEKEVGIDFQAGVEIDRYIGFSSSFYDSLVGGSRYELTMSTNVGDKKAIFTIEIVKNENGYGIYNFNLDT